MRVLKNINNPAPRWFRKFKRIVSLLSNMAVVFLLSLGYSDNSLIILVARVGVSGLMDIIDILVTDGEQPENNQS